MSRLLFGFLMVSALGLGFFRTSVADDEIRDRVFKAKKLTDEAFQKYEVSGKDLAALEEIARYSRVFEELCREYSGDDKLYFVLHLCKLKMAIGETQASVELLEQIKEKGKEGSEERVEARALLFFAAPDKFGDVNYGLDVIRESNALVETQRALYNDLQFKMLYKLAIADSLADLDSTTTIAARAQALGEKCSSLENKMLELEFSPEIAKLAHFASIMFAYRNEQFETLRSLLNDLQPAVELPLIAPHWKAVLWNKWADVHIKQRNYGAALSAVQSFFESATDSQDVGLRVVCNDQKAHLYLRMGDYASARRLLEETRTFQLQNPNLEQSMNWRINMSKSLEGDREFLQAREILIEGLGILNNDADMSAHDPANVLKINFLNNLGVSHYLTGELVRAAELLEESRAIIEKHAMSNQLIAAESMINQGWIELARKHPENSARYFRDAAELVEIVATEDHVRFAEALAGASRAYLALGDRKRAATLIRRAEELAYRKLIQDLQSVFDPRDRIVYFKKRECIQRVLHGRGCLIVTLSWRSR